MRPLPIALLVSTALAAPALASSPAVRTMKPAGGQRGTEVKVTLAGQRLGDAREFLFYRPGITVSGLEPSKDGNNLTATFRIAPDAALGLHDFRLRTASGISTLRTFSVGALKEVEEAEPNNDFAKPQPITMGVTVNGVADREDIDYYAVEAKKGERITAEIEGMRLGLSMFDPYVAILDSKRFELASSDDSALLWQDGFVSVVVPEDGTYIIAARESAYAGNANCIYRLHVGHFPRPTATVPAGGKVGDSVTVRWIGDVLGERTTSLTLPSELDPDFGLIAEDDQGVAPYPNLFRLSPFGNVLEREPNDKPAQATPFEPPMALNGVIEKAGDVDVYTFSAKKGQSYDVRVYARQIRSPLDSILAIGPKKGGNLARNDDTGGPDSYVRFRAPNDGEYVLSVTDHLKKGGPDYAYRVEVSPIEPHLIVGTQNEALRRGTGIQAVAVPRGNRQAILIQATRKDFSGALDLAAANLPSGVAFESEQMPANQNLIPVLFTASADAPIGSSLATVDGKVPDAKQEIPSEFRSTAELVLGQNNVPVWTRTVDALAVAVTEEVPFTIEVVEPKVPLVRGGTLDLKVVAHRKEGFKAPIAVNLPWNPPGVASKGGIVIPEGKDEALIPLNANNGAEAKTWKIVVNGTYIEPPPAPPAGRPANNNNNRRGAGRLTVSSQLAKLTVAPAFLALKFDAVSVEQGKEIDLAVKVAHTTEFPGEAKATLVGLPNKATAESVAITKDTPEVVFHVKTDPTTPPGETKSLFCQVIVTEEGEPIVHNLGSGRFRVDAPLPEKKKPPGAVAAKPSSGAPSKPLSRLEKLRQESRERAKAAAEAGEKP